AHHLPAEAGVLVRLGAAQPVVDVECADPVAESAEGVPETGRVASARHETDDVFPRGNQVVRADVPFDAAQERVRHAPIVAPVRDQPPKAAFRSATSAGAGTGIATPRPKSNRSIVMPNELPVPVKSGSTRVIRRR